VIGRGRDATVLATCCGLCGLAACRGLCGLAACCGLYGLATCFGATTVMLGSGVADPVAVCDTAVSLRPHSNAVDRITTAEGAIRLDDILMRRSPKSGH
jgi:hypothetical protein